MNQIRTHLQQLGSSANQLCSSAITTLRYGSFKDKIVVTSVGFTGLWIIYHICSYASRFFKQPGALIHQPKMPPVNLEERNRYDKEAESLVSALSSTSTPQPPPSSTPASSRLATHATLKSLTIRGQSIQLDQNPTLAEALHDYQKLKTEVKGTEERLSFLARTYSEKGALPDKLDGKEKDKSGNLLIPQRYNQLFRDLATKLQKLGLSLADIQGSDQPWGKAEFTNHEPVNLFKIQDLYDTVRLLAPHILNPLEINIKKRELCLAQQELLNTRVRIIESVFSTIKTLLIDKFVATFEENHPQLFPLFACDSNTLRFVVENIYWHALDLAFTSFEELFVLTDEKQTKILQEEFESKLKKLALDPKKLEEAERLLIKIFQQPDTHEDIDNLVELIVNKKGLQLTAEQETFVQQLQDPQRQLEEQRIQNQVKSLTTFQPIYKLFASLTTSVDPSKSRLPSLADTNNEAKGITFIPHPPQNSTPPEPKPNTYAAEIQAVSLAITEEGKKALLRVGNKQGMSTLRSMETAVDEISKASPGISREKLQTLIKDGWINYFKKADSNKQLLMGLTFKQRFLLTQMMVIGKVDHTQLALLWKDVVGKVSTRSSFLINDLYSRLTIALLALEHRTRAAGPEEEKPADKIARALVTPLLKSLTAFQTAKKNLKLKEGQREEATVQALGKNMHKSALNHRNSDALFLGQLIIELLSMLQLEKLSEEIQSSLTNALTKEDGTLNSTFQRIFDTYNKELLPKAKPWIQPVLSILFQALQHLIERQSSSNIAEQMSDMLSPLNVNALFIDLLHKDETLIPIEKIEPGKEKDKTKWYQDDNDALGKLIEEYPHLKAKIESTENIIVQAQKEKKSTELLKLKLLEQKKEAMEPFTRLAELLLRRWVIANIIPTIPGSFKIYVMQLFEDLFELAQYPRILRNILFHALEQTVQTLSLPSDEETGKIQLNQPHEPQNPQPVLNYFFSEKFKVKVVVKILKLVNSLSTGNTWTAWGYVAQTVAGYIPDKVVQTAVTKIQGWFETFIANKFGNDANYWTIGKLFSQMNATIIKSVKDEEKGLRSIIESQLEKALTPPDKLTHSSPSAAQRAAQSVVVVSPDRK